MSSLSPRGIYFSMILRLRSRNNFKKIRFEETIQEFIIIVLLLETSNTLVKISKSKLVIFTRIRKNLGPIFGNFCQNWTNFQLFTEEKIQILIIEMRNEFRDVEQYTPLLSPVECCMTFRKGVFNVLKTFILNENVF